ncbi:MAG: hypothetical protein SF029_10000 [bacterium]|nr:hypothetical protein [bacterium]
MNLFNLPNPALYRCHVFRYYSGLSRLYLRVFKMQQEIPSFYLLFSDVGYIEGPVSWQGADFRIAPTEECIALMLKTGLVGEAILQFPDAYASITEYAKLYIVDTPNTPVKIIASSTALLPDLPPELK